jgi:hypothetical protein
MLASGLDQEFKGRRRPKGQLIRIECMEQLGNFAGNYIQVRHIWVVAANRGVTCSADLFRLGAAGSTRWRMIIIRAIAGVLCLHSFPQCTRFIFTRKAQL